MFYSERHVLFLLQSILSHFRSYENRVNVAIAVTNKNVVFIFLNMEWLALQWIRSEIMGAVTEASMRGCRLSYKMATVSFRGARLFATLLRVKFNR